jgi:hypothetical protein
MTLTPIRSENKKGNLRLIKLTGSPTSLMGVVVNLENGGELIVYDHLRIIEVMSNLGSEIQWRADPLFPFHKPVRVLLSSILLDRSINPEDKEDRALIEQYETCLTKFRAAASGIKM